MKKLNVLLVCSSGVSSGFIATDMGETVVAGGLDVNIKTRSGSEIENYIGDIDVLMMGPHLVHILDEVKEYTDGLDVKVILMNPDYYSTLNGGRTIDHLFSRME